MKQLISIVNQFQIKGIIHKIKPFGNGHIHDTFRLKNLDKASPDYLLQRINHEIFKNIAPMMANIEKITKHLKCKNSSEPTLIIIPTLSNQPFLKDEQGNYWRIYIFLKNLKGYDIIENEEQIYEGGKMFGKFLKDVADFPAQTLNITIPDFHNVVYRLANLEIAKKTGIRERLKIAGPYLKYIEEIAGEMSKIQKLGATRKIPLRVTHNDTKFNNVLLDDKGKGKCVIDLDTVMPGFVHFDFGDGVRTSISKAAEDEVNLDEIQIELNRYKAFSTGYLEQTKDILTTLELKYFPISGALLAYIMGLRFLTDYILGDIYYKIHFEHQNLQRAKAQLTLCQRIMERLEDLV